LNPCVSKHLGKANTVGDNCYCYLLIVIEIFNLKGIRNKQNRRDWFMKNLVYTNEDFTEEIKQAQFYVTHPNKLLEKVKEEIKQKKIDTPIHNPYPNPYTHKLTYYKGFLKNSNRLSNYLKAISAQNNTERDFYPFILDIEPNRTCNFHCVMCLHGQNKVSKADNMTYEDFVTFMQENDYIMEVKLHGLGEPLLVEGYEKMMQYLVDNHIWSRMVTNGSLLHINDIYKSLVDMSVGEIQCSFDGTNPEMLEKIRKGSKWDNVFNNFKKLNKYSNKQNKLITRMWTVIQKENRNNLMDFVEVAAMMEFRRLSVGFVQTDWGNETLKNKIKTITPELIRDDEKYEMIDRGKIYDIEVTFWNQLNSYSKNKLCPWVFQRPYISAEWKIVPCCIIGDPEVINFGNAYNLKKIWISKAYKEFRQMHISGNIPEYCRSCYEH